jgi:ribosomal protein S18 acetylase RimI-like enzyme
VNDAPLDVRPAAAGDREWAAREMASSEPWLTLRRGFEDCLRALSDPAKELWVGWRGDEREGFLLVNVQGAFAPYLQTICVAAAARGRGTGSALLDWLEARSFARGKNLFLCVSSFNQSARRLYERRGFEVVGPLHDYVVAGHDEILMRKTTGPLAG